MFFTIDGQKIEIGSYCRKFPPAPRSAVRCPALAAGAGPPPVASYFFVQFLLQIFPYIRRVVLGNSLWDSPLFRPVSPGFSPENHTVFRPSSQRTPQNGRKIFPLGFVRDAPKRQENFPLGFRPPICGFSSEAVRSTGATIRFHQISFSSLSTKPLPFLFGTSWDFPEFPRCAWPVPPIPFLHIV